MAQSAGIKRVKPKHHALIALMLQFPHEKAKFFADQMGCTTTWLSIVQNSDAFKEEFAKAAEKHKAVVSRNIMRRAEAVADYSLAALTERLELNSDARNDRQHEDFIPTDGLLDIADKALKHLNPNGGGGPAGNNVTVNLGTVSAEALARAQERAKRLGASFEAEPVLAEPRPDMITIESVEPGE